MAMVLSDPSNTTEEIATHAVASSDVGHHMHKNRLQEYTQKSGLSLPSYSTVNEGKPHAPRFRATILVDGMKYISPYTFSHRKEAEQHAAKHALEIISGKLKESSLNIHKDPTFCKLILNEYGAKLKKDMPTYTTIQQDGLLPIFISTVTFDGKTYVGFAGRSKKEAEQNAACDVIDSILGHHLHKNRLQEYTQRSGLSLPSYSTINEGKPHAPRFRTTILVDGMKYTSPYTFSHRKEAEQDAAKCALEIISVKFKNEGSLNIHKDPTFCKLILNEYGAKLKKDRPTYTTIQQDGLLPTFITTVTFDGKTYVGFAGRTKKEAEQNATCGVIDSILANSNTVAAMAQIIKTKDKLYKRMNNIANAGNATLTTGLMAVAPIGSLPTGPASCVPSTSQLVDISKKQKKKLKKRKADQSI